MVNLKIAPQTMADRDEHKEEPAERWYAEDAKRRDRCACASAASVCTHTHVRRGASDSSRFHAQHARHLGRMLRCKWDWIAATPLGILCLPYYPDAGQLLCMPRCGVALMPFDSILQAMRLCANRACV